MGWSFQVVLGAGPDERRQFGDAGQPVQILLEPEEGFPLVVTLAPAWRPEGEDVSVGQSEFDGDDVSGHEQKA